MRYLKFMSVASALSNLLSNGHVHYYFGLVFGIHNHLCFGFVAVFHFNDNEIQHRVE